MTFREHKEQKKQGDKRSFHELGCFNSRLSAQQPTKKFSGGRDATTLGACTLDSFFLSGVGGEEEHAVVVYVPLSKLAGFYDVL